MGMRISSGGSTTQTAAAGGSAVWQQRQQQFKALDQALQSNNLDAAKTAFAALSNGNSNATSNPNSPLAKLGQALQNGDLSGAQQAMAAMKTQHAGKSHHADNDADDAPKSSAIAASTSATPSPPTATSGNLLNVVA